MKIRVYFSVILPFIMLAGTLFPFFLFAQNSECPVCVQCYTPITEGKYYRLNNKTYCSQSCMKQNFPKCSLCGVPCQKYWTRNLDPGKKLCARCKDLPVCFFCGKPARTTTTNYGRRFCSACSRKAIGDPDTADWQFNKVRRELRNTLKIGTRHRIVFSIVTPAVMEKKKKAKLDKGQTGLFVYQSRTNNIVKYDKRTGRTISRSRNVRETFSIYILTYLPLTEFRYTAAHELTHDWMTVNYPLIKDKKVKEGVSEYIAYLFLQTNEKHNPEARRICKRMELNPDPVYGDGFRMIRNIAGSGSPHQCIKRLCNYLARLNR